MKGSDEVAEFLSSRSDAERPTVIVCPNCGKTYRVPHVPAGARFKCKSCEFKFQLGAVAAEDVPHPQFREESPPASHVDSEASVSNSADSQSESEEKPKNAYFTVRVPRLLIYCIAAVFLFQVIYLAGLVLVELLGSATTTNDSLSNITQKADGKDNPDTPNDPKKVTAEFEIKIEANKGKRSGQTNPLESYLKQAAKQQQQKNRQWSQFMNELSRCKSCGGQGTYSYVDGFGNLLTRTCPYCNGLGNNKLIDDRMRR